LSTFLKVEEGGSHLYWHDCMKWTWGSPFQGFFIFKSNLFFIKAYNQFFEAFFWRKFKYSCKEPWNIGKITTQNVCIGFLYSSMQLTTGDIHNIIEKSLLMILIKIT
jgi:hypothetical protein